MNIWTSYFANWRKFPKEAVPVAICAQAPSFYKGLQYKKLAPSYNILHEYHCINDEDKYVKRFNEEVLSLLDGAKIYKELEELCGGKDCVLLCYEKRGEFCHRHLVAKWLMDTLGIEVKEIS